jgi:hypothetical protein
MTRAAPRLFAICTAGRARGVVVCAGGGPAKGDTRMDEMPYDRSRPANTRPLVAASMRDADQRAAARHAAHCGGKRTRSGGATASAIARGLRRVARPRRQRRVGLGIGLGLGIGIGVGIGLALGLGLGIGPGIGLGIGLGLGLGLVGLGIVGLGTH